LAESEHPGSLRPLSQPSSLHRDEMVGRMVLGRYRIVRRLARGGMGVVYLARSEGAAGFAQPVVIKRIIPDLTGDDQMARMFVREARILSNLRHPNIVQVIEFAEDHDAYVMILEYVHGYHLGRWAKFARKEEGQFSALFAMHVVAKVLDALHHAHTLVKPDGSSYSIVHRDVSPSNVHISVEGQVKLIDFGIARVSRESGEYQTEEISLKGKLPYMAPELFKTGTPSASTDIYACGVMLHELLTGRHEFRGKEMSETVNLVLHHRVSSVSAMRSDVSVRIDDVLRRALAKKPEERFATAEEFASALRAIRGMAESEADALMKERIKRDFQGRLAQEMNVVRPSAPVTPKYKSDLRLPGAAERQSMARRPRFLIWAAG
jgi:serine/threonine protein kinase